MWQTRESEDLAEDVDRTGEACGGDWSGSSCLEPEWAMERLSGSRTSWHCRERERRRKKETQSQKPLERGPVGGAELQLWCRMELQQGVHLLTPSSMPEGLRMLAVPNLRPIVH